MTPLRKPPALKKGDLIGVVAPAGAVKADDLGAGIRRLEELGFRVVLGRSVYRTSRYLAGRDQDRAADLSEMFANPEVKAVVAARGGYGTSRLLPFLDAAALARFPKIFVGSSDLTISCTSYGRRVSSLRFTDRWLARTSASIPRRPRTTRSSAC